MSDRRRRSESSWDRNEAENEIIELSSNGDSPKRLLEINDVFISDDFSMQANENMLMDDDNISDRHRMKTDPAFDDWDGQYSQPYRSGSRVVGGKDRSRSRSRSWSPHRTRDRDRDQDITRTRDLDLDRDQDWNQDVTRPRDHVITRPRDLDGDRDQDWDQDITRPRDQVITRPRDLDRDRDQDWNQDGTRPRDQVITRPRDLDRDRDRDWDQDITRHRDHDTTRPRDQDRARPRDWDRGRTRGQARSRSRSRSRGRATSPSRGGGGLNRLDDDSSQKWGNNRPEHEHEHPSGSHQHRTQKSGYNDQDHRRQPNQNTKPPCKFFIMGRCNRDNCRFSHDLPNSNPHFDDKSIYPGNNQESRFSPNNKNGQVSVDEKPLEASRTENPQASNLHNLNLSNALGSVGPVETTKVNEPKANEPIKASVPTDNKKSTEVNESKVAEKPKGDEGNTGNDEKAMRAFKNALVEFVKEILKPTWKEGKMSREVYKTIVKKVVEKVTSTVHGTQIPRTQEKTEQYLAFSKAKITKLVEAYVGRLVKA